ncbi:hypothetical protein [Pararhodobacter oceanensis]|uniref:NADH-quinone oxidoreductase subunit E n=1 Tax=Pararhodobacter oceanensis TaxID=2172121 RepID=A0A2T8HW51_9RHOB|nr:hypothetical protein [Pararhodobacter oceanensis]PVH29659.1 hypothetical protein DDE20_05955 [Pararhodobacter oceanensis]
MFQGWGFLLSEIWVLIALAGLLGLFVGWLVWGRREVVVGSDDADTTAERLRGELTACQAQARQTADKLARVERELTEAREAAERSGPAIITPPPAPVAQTEGAETEVAEPEVAAGVAEAVIASPEPDAEPEAVGSKPLTLEAPRAEGADDLKRIKGVGPKLEGLLNRLGFWHFDQIATWTDTEIAWVDENLASFKGRVTRDDWVTQAKALRDGG